jgi:hypothetical protein
LKKVKNFLLRFEKPNNDAQSSKAIDDYVEEINEVELTVKSLEDLQERKSISTKRTVKDMKIITVLNYFHGIKWKIWKREMNNEGCKQTWKQVGKEASKLDSKHDDMQGG